MVLIQVRLEPAFRLHVFRVRVFRALVVFLFDQRVWSVKKLQSNFGASGQVVTISTLKLHCQPEMPKKIHAINLVLVAFWQLNFSRSCLNLNFFNFR